MGCTVSFDLNYRDQIWLGDAAKAAKKIQDVLPLVDFLKISEEEMDFLGGEENLPAAMQQ